MELSAQFIKANDLMCDFEQYVPAPYFRKEFQLDFQPEQAEITICGLGFYELTINGTDVTKGHMAPYISNPDDVCYYDHYDLKKYLKPGANVIGILLGNGMRNPFGGFIWEFEKAECRGPVLTALSFHASGENLTLDFEADESFKTHPSPVTFDDIRMGYRYDSRLEIPHWNEPGFDDSQWDHAQIAQTPKGMRKLCEAEPIVTTRIIKPVAVKHYDSLPFCHLNQAQDAPVNESTIRENVYVFDFGVNTSGVTALKINGKPGQVISIRHGEHTIRGDFSSATTMFHNHPFDKGNYYLEYNQRDVFTCKGGEEFFLPKFKYDGFRYAYVEGLEAEQVNDETVTLYEMYSDLKPRATFSCSDETLNRLFACGRQSDLTNIHYFPTDCPHREKNGWTGDASMSAEHMLLNLHVARSLKEWLYSVEAAQREDGALPGIVPTGGWGFEWGNGPTWDSVIVTLPYYIYRFEGDLEPVHTHKDGILKYFRYIMSRRDERGLIAVGLGDWVDPFQYVNKGIASPLEFTDSAMIHNIACKATYLFRAAGYEDAAAYTEQVAAEMKQAIRTHLIDFETMTVAGDCQTSQAEALETGLFEPAEMDAARKRLVEIIHRDGDENHCGMVGVRYLFHALTNAGQSDLAFKMMTSQYRTGYGHWIKDNATTLYESFIDANESVNSRNHHFLGDITSWMIQEVAGLKPNPQVNDIVSVEISPNFIEALNFAEASYETVCGTVSCRWERMDSGVKLTVQVPEGVHGEICLRDGYVCSGEKKLPLMVGTHEYLLVK